MKIMGKNPLIQLDAYTKHVRDAEKTAGKNDADHTMGARQDKVVLSPLAKAIQEAKTILESVPDVREDKIARIKEQISNGTYTIDEKKVAAKMIEESLLNELL